MQNQTVYITKFALTEGIIRGTIQEKLRIHNDYTGEITIAYRVVSDRGNYLLDNDDFGYDPEEAVRKAGKMRDDEIRKLKNRIQELKLKQFSC